MCRVLGYGSRGHASVAELIGAPGLREFTALSAAHGDGWGMAALDGGQIQIAKASGRASDDPEYERLAHSPIGDLGLVHLRWATPGLPVLDRNSHPFRYGDFAMAHNGAIRPQDRLSRMLPPQWEQRLSGSTDSERYFLHIMHRLEARGGDVVAAVADTVQHIRANYTPNSLNAILLGPGTLYAISWHDPERIPYATMRERGFCGSDADASCYFDLDYLVTEDAVVVASTGWLQEGWSVLPNGSVLIIDQATLATRVELF